MKYVPAAISTIILAAHFLRGGHFVLLALTLAAPLLLLVRRSWAVRSVQAGLIAGGLMWLITAVQIGEVRRAMGAPSARMFAILGAVAVFTVLSALPLQSVLRNCENAPR